MDLADFLSRPSDPLGPNPGVTSISSLSSTITKSSLFPIFESLDSAFNGFARQLFIGFSWSATSESKMRPAVLTALDRATSRPLRRSGSQMEAVMERAVMSLGEARRRSPSSQTVSSLEEVRAWHIRGTMRWRTWCERLTDISNCGVLFRYIVIASVLN